MRNLFAKIKWSKLQVNIIAVFIMMGILICFSKDVSGKCLVKDNKTIDRIQTVFGASLSPKNCSVNFGNGFIGFFNFTADGKIRSIKVIQKASNNEQSKNNILSYNDFLELISKINLIQSVGIKLKTGNYGFFTNMRTSVIDLYENAFIKSIQSPIFDEQSPPVDRVMSFCIYYFYNINGTLEDKKYYLYVFADKTNLFKLKIEGNWYYVTEEEFRENDLNTKTVFKVAGPDN